MVQLSQTSLAQRAGVGVSTIADYEKGSRTPIANNLSAIKRALEEAGACFTPDGAMLLGQLSIYLMSESDAAELHLRYGPNDEAVKQQVVGLFGTSAPPMVEINVAQKATASLKAATAKVVEQHAAAAPQLHKLRKFIAAVADDEHFLLLPLKLDTAAEKLRCERYLSRLNRPEAKDDWDVHAEPLFGTLLQRYDMRSLRTDRQTVVGTRRRLGARRCRFCKVTEAEGATFTKPAHLIATALATIS